MTRLYYAEGEFEHGLRCAQCNRLMVEGDEYRERLDNPAFIDTEIGEVFCVVLVCVACDERRDVGPTDAKNAMRQEKLLLDLLTQVPGWVVVKQSEVDRLLNETEALRIERDAARSLLVEAEPYVLESCRAGMLGMVERIRTASSQPEEPT